MTPAETLRTLAEDIARKEREVAQLVRILREGAAAERLPFRVGMFEGVG